MEEYRRRKWTSDDYLEGFIRALAVGIATFFIYDPYRIGMLNECLILSGAAALIAAVHTLLPWLAK
jgi:hypothetical protein